MKSEGLLVLHGNSGLETGCRDKRLEKRSD